MDKALKDGLKFGVLLQLSIGPMCLMTFNIAMTEGFWRGMQVVFGICTMDILFIILAGTGVAKLMQSERTQSGIKLFGCIVLVLFGINTILGAFNISIMPDIALFSGNETSSLYWKCVFLTGSNPLTIVFFSGIFVSQVAEHNYTPKDLIMFGCGIMTVTFLFLTGVAAIGMVLSGFVPDIIIKLLNIAVGLFLIYFGIKLKVSKNS